MRPRVREFGLKPGTLKTGHLNAITDVDGVGVGYSTLMEGDSVRTGVTAITPHDGNLYMEKVVGAVDVFNGYGKATGLTQIDNKGNIETPILITETLNTFKVADALIDYFGERFETMKSINPLVLETNGGFLTNNFERHVDREHVFEAVDQARSSKGRGKVAEGNVGGGTPMTGYGLKGGTGTSSRVFGNFTVGVLVQLNCGTKQDLTITGVPAGREITLPDKPAPSPGNSIIVVIATDLDLTHRQLGKVAKRAMLGIARTGSIGGDTSGDYAVAFTTGCKSVDELLEMHPELIRPGETERYLNAVYRAAVEATEEAILNALFKAETMTGYQGHTRYALPLDQLRDIMEKYGRLP